MHGGTRPPCTTMGGTMKTGLISAAGVALALGIGVAPATATPQDATGRASGGTLLVHLYDVVEGPMDGIPGNRHQVYVLSNQQGAGGSIRSWTCPDGATVTSKWVSSKCTHRVTQDLREKWGDPPQARISSTGRSGVIKGPLVGVNRSTGYVRVLATDLTVRAGSSATLDRDPAPDDGKGESTATWSTAAFSGSVGGGSVWVRGTAPGTSSFFGWLY